MDIKYEKLRTFAKINVHFYKTNKVDFYSNFGLGLVFERIEINHFLHIMFVNNVIK